MKKFAPLIFLFLLFNTPVYSASSEEQKIVGDPFTDFSDFDTSEDEEAVERFYAYGRFIHISLVGQLITPIGGMGQLYNTGFMGTARLSYFFDWNLAIIVNASFGMAQANLPVTGNQYIQYLTGDVQYFNFGVGLKYYFNFHEISKILAFMNPNLYAGGGLYTVADYISTSDLATSRDLSGITIDHTAIAPGIYFGGGFEIPVYEKSLSLGLELTYHLTFFPRNNPNLTVSNFTQSELLLDYSGNFITMGLQLIWNLN